MGGDGREVQNGGVTCVLTADSHCCKAENNTTQLRVKQSHTVFFAEVLLRAFNMVVSL